MAGGLGNPVRIRFLGRNVFVVPAAP